MEKKRTPRSRFLKLTMGNKKKEKEKEKEYREWMQHQENWL